MRLLSFSLLSSLLWSFLLLGQPIGLIERGSDWQFLEGDRATRGSLEGWRTTRELASPWSRGVAPFRYGDGEGGTVLSRMRGRYSSIYLRKSFDGYGPDEMSALELKVDYDDGFVVYLNGTIVQSVNAPRNPNANSFATDSHESGQFEVFEIGRSKSLLRRGRNELAVQVFNVNLSSTDLKFDLELTGFRPDLVAPRLVEVRPASGEVNDLSEITLRFSEAVTGIDLGDVLLSGRKADELSGNGDQWTFRFSSLELGHYEVTLENDHGITDFGRPANLLEGIEEFFPREFELVDRIPPALTRVLPPEDATVRELKRIRLYFSEPISELSVADIRVNGVAPKSVVGFSNGPWTIELEAIAEGPVRVLLSPRSVVTDRSPTPNALASQEWNYLVDSSLSFPRIEISELVASNQSGMTDRNGETHDWIEIVNRGSAPVNLMGWSITDDSDKPGKWVFPDRELVADEHLLVFASGENRREPGLPLHTNFRLSASGGYIGLYSPELPRRLVSEFADGYPEQRADMSYGTDAEGRHRYFPFPTPGEANPSARISRVLNRPAFDLEAGFYQRPIDVTIRSRDPQTIIRYTTDASEPSISHGRIYQGPISIRENTVLRAVAIAAASLPSKVATATYLIDAPDSLQSLPTLSLVSARENLFGRTGIMERNPRNTSQRGIAWERPVSAEWIALDPKHAFQIDCGLRIQGGDYIRGNYRYGAPPPQGKYSFRLYFRGAYGKGRLEKRLIPRTPRQSFEHLVLRAGMNDPTNPFIVDELIRRLYADMGQGSSQGILANLFLNGEYQGYYNPVERIDANFLQSRHGGGTDWDIIAQFGEIRQGDDQEWRRLLRLGLDQDMADPDAYAAVTQLLDIDNFIDYIMLNVYVDMDDWPGNNWRAARERVGGAVWRFYVWDGERAFGSSIKWRRGRNRSRWSPMELHEADNLTQGPLAGSSEIARLFRSLCRSSEFRLRFADRVQTHYFDRGALTEENVLRRYEELRTEMQGVLPDLSREIPDLWIPKRRAVVMRQMASLDLQRSDHAPRFSLAGGLVPDGALIGLQSEGGKIYFTTDGSDPRLLERRSDHLYREAIPINEPVSIQARSLADGQWSALAQANFVPESIGFPLRFSEIMPRPIGGSEYEFVELVNTSDLALNLSWYRVKGIDYTFGFQARAEPRERILLASNKNPAAFLARYPRIKVQGWFNGSLSNKGETLSLLSAEGESLMTETYGGISGSVSVSEGHSLELLGKAISAKTRWQVAETLGGTPGR